MSETKGCTEEVLSKNCNQVVLGNPWLSQNSPDVLYHLGLGSRSHDLQDMFSDVKFVCMGGTVSRMRHFAELLAEEPEVTSSSSPVMVNDLTGHAGRYSMFKVGPVLSVSHGIGMPSMSILMHEVLKLLHHARCTNVTFFRIGTSGGIGLTPGTVVITESAVDELLNPYIELRSLGRVIQRPCSFDQDLVKQLCSVGSHQPYPVTSGTTLCTGDFYEGQGRTDGAFCDFSPDEKVTYLRKLQSAGVKNIEMECQFFGAVLTRAGLRGAVVNVTLVDRLQEDQVVIDTQNYQIWQERPQRLILEFIRRNLTEQRKKAPSVEQ